MAGSECTLEPTQPAGKLLSKYLREHAKRLLEIEPGVHRDDHDAVHDMRVACRRLRSCLRTFAPLLAPELDSVTDELRWLGDVLGAARDAEVIRDQIGLSASRLPEPLRGSDACLRLGERLDRRYLDARDDLLKACASPRWPFALASVGALVQQPPLGERSATPISEAVPPLVRDAWRRVVRRRKRGVDAIRRRGEDADPLLHRARRAAKQLRYAAELCSPAYGGPAERLASQARDIQDVLGRHQDAVVAEALLREIIPAVSPWSLDMAVLTQLVKAQTREAKRARREFTKIWKRASHHRHRRWLRTRPE